MNAATDPHGGFRHSLSDVRDDSFGPRTEKTTFYTPVVPIKLPSFCMRSSWCEQGPLHEGPCDPLETIPIHTIDRVHYVAGFDGELTEVPYQPFIKEKAKTTMKAEAPPNSTYVSFNQIGDFCRGLFVRYDDRGDKFGDGKLVGELTLRTKGGPKVINCKGRLKSTIEHNLPKLKGMVVTVTFVSTTPSKHPQPFKNFEVEYDTLENVKAQPVRQAPTPEIAPDDNDADEEALPF